LAGQWRTRCPPIVGGFIGIAASTYHYLAMVPEPAMVLPIRFGADIHKKTTLKGHQNQFFLTFLT